MQKVDVSALATRRNRSFYLFEGMGINSHVSVLDAILTPALVGLYEARLGKPIRVTRS
jgi:hypothetical protein